ncbi:MAG TPA: FUSC family protein [Stellaceae bacterium]|nr:FUSC family protein [Stellaceae bacterium]
MAGKGHFAEALQWSTETEVEPVELLSSAIGMAAPVLVGAVTGHIALGLAASVGGLAVGGVGIGSSMRAQAHALTAALVPTAVAVLAAVLVSGHGWLTDAAVVLLSCAAATIGGYSRPLVTATIRFMLFLIIAVTLADAAPDRVGIVVLIAAGAFWTTFVSLFLGALDRAYRHRASGDNEAAPAKTAPKATAAQKLARWKNTLTHLSGWQYTLRLAFCLAVAGVLRSFWQTHHLHWIALTVALLSQRQVEAFPIKTTQRALGTAAGVVLTGLVVAHRPPGWSLILGIGLLAGARPLLKARNYLAYSTIMTPLIILIMDAGQMSGSQPLYFGVLLDRVTATFIGAGLVIATNVVAGRTIGSVRPNAT